MSALIVHNDNCVGMFDILLLCVLITAALEVVFVSVKIY